MRLTDNRKKPSRTEERKLAKQGYQLVAGIDEAGRGALAGPVVAAAVILPLRLKGDWLGEVRDSKMLTPKKRERLFHHIHRAAVSVGIGMTLPEMIDEQGIVKATRLAMKAAVDRLSPAPHSLLIDYMSLPEAPLPQKGITRGDQRCLCIACASIMAKVSRDRLMMEMDRDYPGYGLARHKGYGTRRHLSCLRRMGPSPIHRRSFRPVREALQR